MTHPYPATAGQAFYEAAHALKRALEYPFHEREPADLAEQMACAILYDLSDRGGIKHAFSDLDEAVRVEIVEAHAAIIRAALATQPETKPLTVPADVIEAAQRMKAGNYRGPLAWARKVFDWVATQPVASSGAAAEPTDFWAWVRRAYRNPEATAFTVHNMAVAYRAGRDSVADQRAPSTQAQGEVSRDAITALVDAAMAEMKNVVPPLRRSECERLIRAALAEQAQTEGDPEEDAYVIQQLGRLLAEIAVAIKGPELPRRRWGYHDLPQLVQELVNFKRAAVAQCPNCGGTRAPHALDPLWTGRCKCAAPQAEQRTSEAGDDIGQQITQAFDALIDAIDRAPAVPSAALNRGLLRAVVDAAWKEATESQQVPSTSWADRIIDSVMLSEAQGGVGDPTLRQDALLTHAVGVALLQAMNEIVAADDDKLETTVERIRARADRMVRESFSIIHATGAASTPPQPIEGPVCLNQS